MNSHLTDKEDDLLTTIILWLIGSLSALSVVYSLITLNSPAHASLRAYPHVRTTFDKLTGLGIAAFVTYLAFAIEDRDKGNENRLRFIFGLVALGSLMSALSNWVPIEHDTYRMIRFALKSITALAAFALILKKRENAPRRP